MNNPLVCVVIIFLNAEEFIQEAIESVFAQTYDNWEILLVDDGSTDRSTAIALQYAEQHPEKVRYLQHDNHENRGMSASRNKGISNAHGKYIALLDADDVWLPPKLKQQVAILESQPEAAMVYGPPQRWYSWTGKPEDMQRDYMPELGVQPNTLIKPLGLLSLFLRNEDIVPTPSGILVRRNLTEEIGGFDETFRGMYEDMVFYAKVSLKAPVFVASECWVRYRQHLGSCCSVAQKTGEWHPANLNPAQLNFLNWLCEYLSKQGVGDSEVWQAVQKALWPYRHPNLYRLLSRIQHLIRRIKGRLKLILKLRIRQTLAVKV